MTVIQQQLGIAPYTFTAWYDGAAGEMKVGYNVCYDPAAADGTVWDDQKLWTTVIQPTTATLDLYAGVVVAILQGGQKSDDSCYVTVALPTRGSVVEALCNVNATAGVTVLTPTDGSWALTADAGIGTLVTGGGDAYTISSVAIAGETANTSGTAANKRIFGLL